MTKRKHRSPAEWEAIHQDWKDSDLFMTQFCNKIGLSPQSLYNYRQRRDDSKPVKPKKKASSFVELGAIAAAQTPLGIPLEIVLNLGNGIELTIRRPS
tara:strand:+ start:170 stop:463 length:294 start_codon:yes stop_codon:yes gene_type:complete